MATVYKRGGSPYWYTAYFDSQGKRVYRSTGETKKQDAIDTAIGWEAEEKSAKKAQAAFQPVIASILTRAGREANEHKLTLDKARRYLTEF